MYSELLPGFLFKCFNQRTLSWHWNQRDGYIFFSRENKRTALAEGKSCRICVCVFAYVCVCVCVGGSRGYDIAYEVNSVVVIIYTWVKITNAGNSSDLSPPGSVKPVTQSPAVCLPVSEPLDHLLPWLSSIASPEGLDDNSIDSNVHLITSHNLFISQ